MSKIGIFRLQLFKPSEGFITSQTNAFSKYEPVFVGRKLFGSPLSNKCITPKPINQSISAFFAHIGILFFRLPGTFLKLLIGLDLRLLHAHFAVDGVSVLPLARKLNIPLVVTLHGMDVTRSTLDMLKSGSPNLVNYVIYKNQLFKNADLFICVSDFIRNAALAKGFPESKLLVHYIGIDSEQLSFREGAGEDGLIVHVGRLVEKKGTTYLLDAFAKVKQKIINAELVIIGDGPLRANLEAKADALGVKGAVKFFGVQPNQVVLHWIRRAAVMAVPSVTATDGDMEGFGIVNIEASAQGVPVVGFRSGGIPEAIIDGKTGLLVEERDVAGLTKNIVDLLTNPQLRLQLGKQARKNVEDNFNIKKQSAKLESIYDNLISTYKSI